MKLDLLYEFQPKIKPWDKPHPVRPARGGAADATTRPSREIQSPTSSGSTPCGASSTTSATAARRRRARRRSSAGSPCRPSRSSSGFGVTLMPFGFIHPARVAEKVATVDVLSHGRVEWGTGRSTPMEQAAFGVPTDDRSPGPMAGGDRDRRRDVGERAFSWDERAPHVPRADADPQAVPGSAPAGVAGGGDREPRAITAGELGLGLLSFALLQPVEKMADHISSYRSAQLDGRDRRTSLTRGTQRPGRRLHPGPLLRRCRSRPADYGLWESVNWWYRHLAEFTLQLGAAEALASRNRRRSSRCSSPSSTARSDVRTTRTQDMIIIGTPGGVPGEDHPLRRGRRRPAALLRAIRRPAAREGDAQPRAARHAR